MCEEELLAPSAPLHPHLHPLSASEPEFGGDRTYRRRQRRRHSAQVLTQRDGPEFQSHHRAVSDAQGFATQYPTLSFLRNELFLHCTCKCVCTPPLELGKWTRRRVIDELEECQEQAENAGKWQWWTDPEFKYVYHLYIVYARALDAISFLFSEKYRPGQDVTL